MKHTHHISWPHELFAVLLIAAFVIQAIFPAQTHAAQIINRSLTLQAGATDGGSKAGGVVNHAFQFTLPGLTPIGSIKFEYCTTAAMACTVPTGINVSSATLGTENGWTGVTVVKPSANVFYLSKASASAPSSATLSYQIKTITNPTDNNKSFYVRITTHASTDTTGAIIDSGVVTASTAEPIIISGTMPESLVFCTGENIYTTVGVPDCTNPANTDGIIAFDKLFSPTDTAVASSQMAASTNAGWGYVITVNGPTLTSGTNTILAMGTQGDPIKGTSQFGLNLKANTALTTTSMNVGLEVAPNADSTDYFGVAYTGYDQADKYKFNSGDTVATSNLSNLPNIGATNAQIFTVSYMANVPGKQAAGTYTTTLTYICTPTF